MDLRVRAQRVATVVVEKARSTPMVVVALVLLFTAFDEVDRVGAQFPGSQSNTLSILGMTGPLALTRIAGWHGWVPIGDSEMARDAPAPAILLYLILDAAFIGLYCWLIARGIRRWMPSPTAGERAAEDGPQRLTAHRRGFWALIVLLAFDAMEDVLLIPIMVLLWNNAAVPDCLAWVTAGASTLKFVGFLLVIIAFVRTRDFTRDVFGGLRRLWGAVYAQRLSAVVVVVLAALSLLPPWNGVLEQVPDVERAWVDSGLGWFQLFAALFALILLAFVAFLLGRKRAQLYWETHVLGRSGAGEERLYGKIPSPKDGRRAWPQWRYLIWATPFVVVLVVGVIYLVTGNGKWVDLAPWLTFLGVIFVIVGISLVLEAWLKRRGKAGRGKAVGAKIKTDRPEDREFVLRVSAAGDALAGLVVIVGALGFARSFGAEVVVTAVRGEFRGIEFWRALLFVAAAIISALVVTYILGRIKVRDTAKPRIPASWGRWRRYAHQEFDPRQDTPTITPLGLLVGGLAAFFSVLTIGVFGLYPLTWAGTFGVVAVTVGLLGSITSLLGIIVLTLRRRRPLAIFELAGFRSDPVIALVLVIPFIVSQFSGSGALHAVDRPAPSAQGQANRVTLQKEFTNWLGRSEGCDTTVDGVKVRPLVLVAAEGGGIRAATWTVAVLSQLSAAGVCPANSVFLSSGVSGGSVGLAVATTLDRHPNGYVPPTAGTGAGYPGAALDQIKKLSDSAALPAAVVGLIGSDPLAGMTGLRSATLEDPTQWRDRATLIEDAWRESDAHLTLPWNAVPTAPTGLVVFNSTDILSGCRVVISQVKLGSGVNGSTTERKHVLEDGTPAGPRCDQGSSEPALSLDLLDFYGTCPFAADWATASMLSARFPVVTPGGVVDLGDIKNATHSSACPALAAGVSGTHDRVHLVDGGYAENTGLGLIADISPELSRIVADYNSSTARGDGALVVPYLMYIQNSPGAYLVASVDETVPELSVPQAGFGTKAMQVTPDAWIQRAMASLGELCAPTTPTEMPSAVPTPAETCLAAVSALNGGSSDSTDTSDRVVIAAADTVPSITVPLGWGLSGATYRQLKKAAEDQADLKCDKLKPAWTEYSCVGQLIGLMKH